mmetsp:Transcript_27959/g.87094  ORF Transcript_27959/g.87094 Transcript_27959/m.87094 type:complete len:300 (-) Transcript_27959:48-947(-)
MALDGPVLQAHQEVLAEIAADCEFQEADVHSSTPRKQRSRLHPRNWGYTTYLDRVFSLNCFFDLVRLQVFPGAKDISESYGAIAAAFRHCGLAPSPEKAKGVLCLAVGDGATPRTASLAAFITRWTCVSIDPALRPEWAGDTPQEVRSLHGFRGTLEDWVPQELERTAGLVQAQGEVSHVMILCVHSHNRFAGTASVPEIRRRLGHPAATLVSLPCCRQSNPQHDLGRPPDVSFEDLAIFSMCRAVNVWAWGAGDAPGVVPGEAALPPGCPPRPRLPAEAHAAAMERRALRRSALQRMD